MLLFRSPHRRQSLVLVAAPVSVESALWCNCTSDAVMAAEKNWKNGNCSNHFFSKKESDLLNRSSDQRHDPVCNTADPKLSGPVWQAGRRDGEKGKEAAQNS